MDFTVHSSTYIILCVYNCLNFGTMDRFQYWCMCVPLQLHVIVESVHENQLVMFSDLLFCKCLVWVQPWRVKTDLMLLGNLSIDSHKLISGEDPCMYTQRFPCMG